MILIADNLTVTNRAVQRALDEKDPEPIRQLVKRCEAAGAEAIDINSGPLVRDAENRMTFLVDTVQGVTDLPLLIDTASPRAIEAGPLRMQKQSHYKRLFPGAGKAGSNTSAGKKI